MTLEFGEIGLRILLGTVIGFAIGLTGIGGGVLLMPSLTWILGLSPSMAVGTASLFAVLAKSYAVFEHLRLKHIRFRPCLLFLSTAVPANIGVAFLVTHLANQGNIENFQGTLKNIIAITILSAIVFMAINFALKKRQAMRGVLPTTQSSKMRTALGVTSGLLVGGLIGATSVGGGVMVIPVLIIFFGLSANQTVGSSIFIAVVLTFINSIVYFMGGNLDAWTAIFMVIGSLPGIFLGSRLVTKLSEQTLQLVIMFIILISGVLMFVDGAGH
ncbi:sulfite exporter TauE/SafE family protein [Planctomycetota bacterium]